MKHLPVFLFVLSSTLHAADPAWLTTGEFQWKCSPPLISPAENSADPDAALKDPTMVLHEGKWHLFATHRRASGTVDMQYLSFTDWKDADKANRHKLDFHDQYHCAPQVFFFTPQQKWYLIYYRAWLADKLEGPWQTLATTREKSLCHRRSSHACAQLDQQHRPRRTPPQHQRQNPRN